MEAASGFAGHVKATLCVNIQGLEQAEDTSHAQLGEVGKRRPQVGRPDRCDTQYSCLPRFVRQQPAGIEPAHAMADQVHWLIAECSNDLFAQSASPALDAGDRLNSRHQDSVADRLHGLRDATEVRRQGKRTDSNTCKPKQAMGQYNWCIETYEYRLGLHQGCQR